MKFFGKPNLFFLFLVFISYQHSFAIPLTKAEAHKAMILNDHLRGVAFNLQTQPFKSEVSRKSAELAINELERLGQKDPSSPFAQDAQKWKEVIGKFASLSRGQSKNEVVDAEKVAAAKNEVDKALEDIKNLELQKRFVIKEQKESMAINEAKTIKSAEAELRLLVSDKQRLKDRAEEIKKEYEEAIVIYMTQNRNALKKQWGSAPDVSKETKSFNKRIDVIVKMILKEQRDLKKKQPGGLSVEDALEEFNEFIVDQKKVEKKPISQDEKNSIDQQLFGVISLIVESLRGQATERITSVFNDIETKSMEMVDAQFEKPSGIAAFFAASEDAKRKEFVSNKIGEIFESLLESAQEEASVQQADVEQVIEQVKEQEPGLPSTPPKRPASSKPVTQIKKPSQPKIEEQKKESQAIGQEQSSNKDIQDLSVEQKLDQMKNEFTAWIARVINNTKEKADTNDAVYGDDQDSYDDVAIKKAEEMMKFLAESSDVGALQSLYDSIKTEYNQAIKDQIEANKSFVYSSQDSSEYNEVNRTKRFNDKLREVFEKYTQQQEEIAKK